MGLSNFSFIDLGNGRGRVTFLEPSTGEYHTDPMVYPTTLENAKARAEKLDRTWKARHNE